MNRNIFEGAKFGDKFIDNTNNLWLYISEANGMFNLIPNRGYTYNDECLIQFCSNGKSNNHQLSKYQEPIDEEKLEELAENYRKEMGYGITHLTNDGKKWFKVGYRKAKEE